MELRTLLWGIPLITDNKGVNDHLTQTTLCLQKSKLECAHVVMPYAVSLKVRHL